MRDPDPEKKLRLAPQESAEDLARRHERERRGVLRQVESAMEESLEPFRVGSVPYLNAAPLTRGIEDQIIFAPPSELAAKLRRDELDAALVSVTEILLTDRYDILDGVAVAALGEVRSVFLAHTQPLGEIREIHCDSASLAGNALLRVLLAERGLKPEFKPLTDYAAAASWPNVFLIGDPAIAFSRAGLSHQIWDLGEAWNELTSLPFVFAAWALRRIPNDPLRKRLREVKHFGLDTLDHIISSRSEFDYEFRKDYLGWHIHYHLGSEERRGIARFVELLNKHGLGPAHEPHYVA